MANDRVSLACGTLMQVRSTAECWEHSAILLTCIKWLLVVKTFFWSSLTGFTVHVIVWASTWDNVLISYLCKPIRVFTVHLYKVGLFVWVDFLCPRQQFSSHVGTGLPRLNQYSGMNMSCAIAPYAHIKRMFVPIRRMKFLCEAYFFCVWAWQYFC